VNASSNAPGVDSPLVGAWAYRSFNDDPDLSTSFDDLEFGQGTLVVEAAPVGILAGHIGGPGWRLELTGSIAYGDPFALRFQGAGVVGGDQWIYDYVGYLVPNWPNGKNQVPALVGSTVRAIPHPGGDGGLHPAGVVASWYAVRMPAPPGRG
jgi:hypothetical protein